jgi:hypothetical protein
MDIWNLKPKQENAFYQLPTATNMTKLTHVLNAKLVLP